MMESFLLLFFMQTHLLLQGPEHTGVSEGILIVTVLQRLEARIETNKPKCRSPHCGSVRRWCL